MPIVLLVLLALATCSGALSLLRPLRRQSLVAAWVAWNLILVVACILVALPTVLFGGSLVLASFLVIAWSALAGGPVVRLVLSMARRDGLEFPDGSLPASAWIGCLERAAITLSLSLGLPEFAAILLGIKALGQYSGGGNHHPAGRVLGTLASTIWALLCFSVLHIAARGVL